MATQAADFSGSEFQVLPTNAAVKITGVHETHKNYLAVESSQGPLAVSVILDDGTYKVLVRTSNGSERQTVSKSAVAVPWWRRVIGGGVGLPQLLSAVSPSLPARSLRLSRDLSVPSELLAMEERQVIRSYKFGLAYIGGQQSSEADLFANTQENTSPAFRQFQEFLGEIIELKGWKGYRAGLDGYEIMFHVATFLPFNDKDKQQLERKRHIGNDIVVVIFSESEQPFKLGTITSQQNHVIAIVQPIDGEKYRLTMAAKSGVPEFTPELPEPTVFGRDPVSRDFLLHKLVNGERASYRSPSFAPKIARTRGVLLHDVASKH
ncbi:hypothetical protein HK405_011033 [Cladochytrium tenue]|nr:hypothetical protein HK405_011033 [Cladochytrium tenue]